MKGNFVLHAILMLMIGFIFSIPSTLLSQGTKEDEVRKRI